MAALRLVAKLLAQGMPRRCYRGFTLSEANEVSEVEGRKVRAALTGWPITSAGGNPRDSTTEIIRPTSRLKRGRQS